MIVTESISKIDQDFRIREISIKSREDFNQFDCDNTSLNSFLKRQAFFEHIDFKSRTQLVYRDSNLLAYFTLKESKIELDTTDTEDEEDSASENLERHSLDIYRLAVDNKFKNSGIGSSIMKYIVTLAKTVNKRYITLDAIYEYWKWYHKRGFEVASEDQVTNNETTIYMLMDLYDQDMIEKHYDE
ncbi:GNAT family N-acetyltransferase [Sporolactobacillus sp. STCC-11]|uniref:GNAT family N-acetyltransferase n=1 Tax=Sporolactobacillus caesalpiniae TaxID=3230362 RepID=UPI003395F8C0